MLNFAARADFLRSSLWKNGSRSVFMRLLAKALRLFPKQFPGDAVLMPR